MVGPQYDMLTNPLGAVRQTFEKVVAQSQPSDLDPTATYMGKDWGVVDLFNQFLFEQGGLSQVPILDATSQKWIQPNTLVRFRGMVQDMLGNELYVGAFKDGFTWRTNKYTDFSSHVMSPALETTLWERHLFHCIPVPGQNSWSIESTPQPIKTNNNNLINGSPCQHGEKRRRDEDSPNGILDTCDEGSSSSNKKQKDFGLASRDKIADINNECGFPSNSFSCLIKTYDMPESQLKLNEVFEFIGIYTFDPVLNLNHDKDDDDVMLDFIDDVAVQLPPSKVPRLHCLISRKLSTHDFISSPNFQPLPSIMREIRNSLFEYLNSILGNDSLAAQCLLLHFISKLRTKSEVATAGRLSLNLTGFTRETNSIFGNQLNIAIKTVLPFSYLIPLTVQYLNNATLQPKKDNHTGRLVMGDLQLANGTHLTFDETNMQSGTLNSKGLDNLHLLKHLMDTQMVEYDFEYYKLEMPTEAQFLIISEGKSNILPADLVVPVQFNTINNAFNLTEDKLQAWRWYLATVKSFPHSTDLTTSEKLENEMVNAIREDRSIGFSDMCRWMTMAQLMAASFGEEKVSLEHWQMVKEIEKLRKSRL